MISDAAEKEAGRSKNKITEKGMDLKDIKSGTNHEDGDGNMKNDLSGNREMKEGT